ncbi:MAG: class I SAM-dependent methyltransferase [Candidatus Thorarchaeota archaeon]|jgi:SAM-dependent methyltransferase
MRDDENQPIAYDAYETMADTYAATVETKVYNAFIERPTTLSLLPAVNNKHVLDAGCGPGIYSEWLVKHGATVVAVDASPKMVEHARKKLGKKVKIHLANLEKPLEFLDDDFFDIVLSALVPDYILDWQKLFREFSRILKEDGILVFSVEHPFTKFNLGGTDNYFETERLVIPWSGFGKTVDVPTYRRPLTVMIQSLVDTGLVIEDLRESLPTEEVRELEPETYEKTSRFPTFLSIRGRKVH